jgi:hypothetical protein
VAAFTYVYDLRLKLGPDFDQSGRSRHHTIDVLVDTAYFSAADESTVVP